MCRHTPINRDKNECTALATQENYSESIACANEDVSIFDPEGNNKKDESTIMHLATARGYGSTKSNDFDERAANDHATHQMEEHCSWPQ